MRTSFGRFGLGLLALCAAVALAAGPATASDANLALVKRFYDASGHGDAAGALSLMSPGMVWNEAESGPLADRDPYVGPKAIVEGVFARIGAHFNAFTVEIDQLLDGGDTIVMLGRYHGVEKETGKTLNAQVAHVWTVADGKLVKFQQYTDTAQWNQVMKP